jgi:glycosyltransferase involved in cell wall biosynthesis
MHYRSSGTLFEATTMKFDAMKHDARSETSRVGPSCKLALVLWNGYTGGAETLTASLAERMRLFGADITIVFVEQPGPLAKRLADKGVPHRSLNFGRGRDVLLHPWKYAAMIRRNGPDGALLTERGFMGTALRLGGYRGPVVAIEHGALVGLQRFTKSRRLLWKVDYALGSWADDVEVAVSDFMLRKMLRHPHARMTQRIYNGIDPDMYSPSDLDNNHDPELTIGFAGRLIKGKGADHLILATARASEHASVRLLIAGDGPERSHLAALVHELGASSQIEFVGTVEDLPTFWHQCDIAAVPSHIYESFSMVTLEAMACGKPVVATRSGAIPELVIDNVTGMLISPGDVDAFTHALITYAEQPQLRLSHGAAARLRAYERFHIDACAQAYLDLFGKLNAHVTDMRGGMRAPDSVATKSALSLGDYSPQELSGCSSDSDNHHADD